MLLLSCSMEKSLPRRRPIGAKIMLAQWHRL
jgi:hypothetical protein